MIDGGSGSDGVDSHTPAGQGRRGTSARILFWDKAATSVITVGGLGVLAAMLGICLFLFSSAAPLFARGSAEPIESRPMTGPETVDTLLRFAGQRDASVLHIGADGWIREIAILDGAVWFTRDLGHDGLAPSAAAYDHSSSTLTLGYPDGSACLVKLDLDERLIAEDTLGDYGIDPETLGVGERLELEEGGSLVRLTERRWGIQRFGVEKGDQIQLGDGRVMEIASAGANARRRHMIAAFKDGGVRGATLRIVRRLDGAGESVRARVRDLSPTIERPAGVWVTADGESAFVLSSDGRCEVLDPRDGRVKQAVRLCEFPITAHAMALSNRTLVVGDEQGVVTTWTWSREDAQNEPRLARTGRIVVSDAAVTSIEPNKEDRTLAIGSADGRVTLWNATSGKTIVTLETGGAPIRSALLGPGLGRLTAYADGGAMAWAIDPGHPKAGWRSLFGKIHYEGYVEPEFVYQSTGSGGVEAKLSLVPLIWGTLKATIVTMLIATPIAVLAAVYSSEFMGARTRSVVKPSVELMASLPSVVLGFIAAMVVAPYVRDHLFELLMLAIALPACVMIAAHLWRLLPHRMTTAMIGNVLLASVFVGSLAVGVVVWRTASTVEHALFAPSEYDHALAAGLVEPADEPGVGAGLQSRGLASVGGETVRVRADLLDDSNANAAGEPGLISWLTGGFGAGWPGWAMLFIVPAVALVMWADRRTLGRAWASVQSVRSRRAAAFIELVRFCVAMLIGTGLAVGIAMGLGGLGVDPRDSVLGGYTQRNTLIVGAMMGFAVVPIIYTIADDAMRSVPGSLRSASLGAGATRWQTATRVVLPVAGSGIFSACMIGLGRAVGETMIVLMATGNTPIMDVNIFSGFRTLAANIAVEMPEAPRGGTHYRVLFLCGLALFAMTFVINTTAELVRQSFRKKSAAL